MADIREKLSDYESEVNSRSSWNGGVIAISLMAVAHSIVYLAETLKQSQPTPTGGWKGLGPG